jgi:hypothetical protein
MVFACGSAPRIAELPRVQQQGIPIVDLPAPTAKSSVSQGGVLGVRQVSNGNVLVNDAGNHQLKLLDSSLKLVSILRDSTSGSPTSYGNQRRPMVPYIGDSVLFADMDAGTILLLNPQGQTARVIAPLNQEMLYGLDLSSSKGIDSQGRILYQTGIREDPMLGLARAKIPDSALVVRADLETRRIDTLARIKSSGTTKLLGREGSGPLRFFTEPVPLTDDWAELSDGTLGVVRGRDYHVDWIHPDGSVTSTPKLPFDWRRLSDEEKQHIVDSMKTEVASRLGMAMGRQRVGPVPDQQPGQRQRVTDVVQGAPMPTEYVAPELKDIFGFNPPLRRGSVMSDLDGNLWILPTTSAQSKNGELIYDVVNPKGDFHRVRVPLGRSIVGFARGGVVYMVSGDKTSGFYLERSQLPQATSRR